MLETIFTFKLEHGARVNIPPLHLSIQAEEETNGL